MPLIRAMMDAGKRMLARRLDQLFETLENLRGQLRNTIASAVGETIGMLVRDSALRVLQELPSYGHSHAPPFPHHQPEMRGRSSYHNERGYWDDDHFEEEDEPTEHSSAKPVCIPTALSAGLQVASWWASRWPASKQPITMLAVALTATAAAFYGGPLVIVLFGLAHAATRFTSSA